MNKDSNIHTHRFYAMGCQMAIWLETADEEQAAALLRQATARFITAEKRLSRFDPDSELCRLNERPEQWVVVSAPLWRVVTRALRLAAQTGGLYDPTLLAALERAGYRRSFEQHLFDPEAVEESATGPQTGRYYAVRLDPARQAVWLPAGVRLDLGGIGKGYTAAEVLDFLYPWGPCLIDAGGDLTAGNGPPGWPGWPVGIAAPQTGPGPRENLFHLWLNNASLATSGIDYRRWEQNGRLFHHIIDPRTGQPAKTDAATVSVLARDAAAAEAWATAALVAGAAPGYELLAHQRLAAAFVGQDKTVWLTPAWQAGSQPFTDRPQPAIQSREHTQPHAAIIY